MKGAAESLICLYAPVITCGWPGSNPPPPPHPRPRELIGYAHIGANRGKVPNRGTWMEGGRVDGPRARGSVSTGEASNVEYRVPKCPVSLVLWVRHPRVLHSRTGGGGVVVVMGGICFSDSCLNSRLHHSLHPIHAFNV